ncbi:hypothetical protein ANN_19362 [Periplaneta americana]|uniref:Uncharacterized protein n=1 Tax=Periplaneta americana TaxID=6978 RepID=A0ABQ8SA61_PERAM|nr:hypothetical protein ANN_19362 [Periplaneta americana]
MAGLCEGGNEPPDSLKAFLIGNMRRHKRNSSVSSAKSDQDDCEKDGIYIPYALYRISSKFNENNITLAHVLGSCPHGEVLRNSRHHRIRSMIAEQFRSINFQVFEEVHGLEDNGSTRRIDMIAIPPNNNNGYIIDPTV